jgi:hypothetical protein
MMYMLGKQRRKALVLNNGIHIHKSKSFRNSMTTSVFAEKLKVLYRTTGCQIPKNDPTHKRGL